MASPSSGEFTGTERFQILRRIGAGGMGVVYEALDKRYNLRIALKTLSQSDPWLLYFLKKEFRSLADITHPNLAFFHELISEGDRWFFTMELIDGEDFLSYARPPDANAPVSLSTTAESDRTLTRTGILTGPDLEFTEISSLGSISRATPLPGIPDINRARKAIVGLLEGLSALHAAGILHRDIKPSNVLVTPDGNVKILDFGLALEHRSERSVPTLPRAGTLAYMAPETLLGKEQSEKTDLYSAGIMLFETFTGFRPRERSSAAEMVVPYRDPPSPQAEHPATPDDLDLLTRRLLAWDPRDRPTAGEALALARDAGAFSIPSTTTDDYMVGRSDHLRALRDALGASRSGSPSATFLHGPSGMGKSTLLHRFAEELRSQKAIVLFGRCFLQESVPFKAFDAVIDQFAGYLNQLPTEEVDSLLPRDTPALARIFPVLRQVGSIEAHRGIRVVSVDQHELRRQAFAALRSLFSRLADRQPLVVIVDDLQWSDNDSITLLTELLRPPGPPDLLFIGGFRSEQAEMGERYLRALRGLPEATLSLRELEVGPLSIEDVRRLGAELLRTGVYSAEFAERLARDSAGNPFFIHEFVQRVHALRDPSAVPPTVDEILRDRLSSLNRDARAVLEVIAVSGQPLSEKLVCEAAGLTQEDPSLLAELRIARLIRASGSSSRKEVYTYHDRIAENIMDGIDPMRRQVVHGRLARALERSGAADPEALGFHFEGAREFSRAARFYEIAAEQASHALAFDLAVDLYRHALRLTPTGAADIQRNLVGLAEALANAGRGLEAARAYEDASRQASAEDRWDLQRKAAYEFCASGHLQEGRAAMSQVLARAGISLPSSPTLSLLLLLLNRGRLGLRGYRFTPRAVSEIPARQLRKIDACWSAGTGLGMVDLLASGYFVTQSLLLALQSGEKRRIARALAWEAANYSSFGPSAASHVEKLLDACVQIVDRTDPYSQGMYLLASGAWQFHSTRWREAIHTLGKAEAIFQSECTGASWELWTSRILSLLAYHDIGEYVDLTSRSAGLMEEARQRGNLYAATTIGVLPEPIAQLVSDDPGRALRVIDESYSGWPRDEFHVQHVLGLLTEGHVLLYQGQPEQAAALFDKRWKALSSSILMRGHMVRAWLTLIRGRAFLAAAARCSSAPDLLVRVESAARTLDKEKTEWTTASSGLLRAGAAALRGDRETAVLLAQKSLMGYVAADMAGQAASVRYALSGLIGGEGAASLLQEAENWAREQRVRNLPRFAAMCAPGLLR